MKSKRIDRSFSKKVYQRQNIIKPTSYHTGNRISMKSDRNKNRAMWELKMKECRGKSKELKKDFGETWTWYDIGQYILKMLRFFKKK